MANTNEVDTQITDDLNTETELENNEEESQEQNQDEDNNISQDNQDDDSNNESNEINPLDMDDEDFIRYFESTKQSAIKEDNKHGDRRTQKSSDDEGEESHQRSSSDTGSKGRGSGGKNQEQDRRSTDANKETGNRKDVSSEIDYKTTYEEIFKPFKANGKDITPKTTEDVISLMQMGANYTKKMQIMAPMRKTFESLSKAQINDNDLNFLIDIHKGDKEAIKKLLEKHKVDPMELDMDETNYVPGNNLLSEQDIEYLNSIEDAQPSLPKINEIITNKWDATSKELLLEDPTLVTALHEEIQLGRFDDVQAKLEEEKTFGRYKGIPDIRAYIDIVTKMLKEKESSNTNQNATNSNKKPTNTPKRVIPDKSKAAPNKSVKAAPRGTDLSPRDILSMSDEDIMKLDVRGLY